MKEIRVRFAPSPTGSLHIGGVRTALYNYLFARKHGGKFIIRIEDTDQNRLVAGAEEYIYESLAWLGVNPDEGVKVGGPFTPYKQSERKEMYAQYAMQLVESGFAYYAFDTPEELEAIREKLKAEKVDNFQYGAATRHTLVNSLTLSDEEVKARISAGAHYVIRLKVPKNEEIRLNDLIRGWVMVHSSTMDDKVLMKSDGMPTYHLANVVDDYLMQISHVIRGEEWLPSAPTHVLLYKYFGWESAMPEFAHLPLLLKPNGEGKLSKRDGEMMGFPVFPLQWTEEETGKIISGFREEGYLPEALINFLAFLGWNPGTEQELFTMDELVEAFSIERIGKSGSKFDIAKAKWYNQHYLHQRSPESFVPAMQKALILEGFDLDATTVQKLITLVKDRATFEKDMVLESVQVLQVPSSYDEAVVASKWNEDARNGLQLFASVLGEKMELNASDAKDLFNQTMESNGIKPGKVLQMLRVALTGKGAGPDLMTIIEILGTEACRKRIERMIVALGA